MLKQNRIDVMEFEINNQRTMQLTQQTYDGNVTFTTYKKESGKVDYEETISPGDMVMLMNYYRFQKENNLPI